MKMFFATDIHGSEICWKKFLNAAAFYKADLVVRCYRRAFELYDVFMDTAVASGKTGFERLSAYLRSGETPQCRDYVVDGTTQTMTQVPGAGC